MSQDKSSDKSDLGSEVDEMNEPQTIRASSTSYRRKKMSLNINWDEIAGKWKQVSGEAKKQWGKLTDDEISEINGDREILAGKIQEKYGIAKEHANNQIDKWAGKLKV
jgi:uncharacterized protein YjbJ (UPF0337 family)